jgi:sugar/nucleoside kinase (ribokinase family)
MSRVLVLGDLNLDILADAAESAPAGDEVRGVVRVEAGGSAGTFARVAASLGATVIFLGAVGQDIAGDLLERSLRDAGVEPRLRRVNIPSGAILAIRRGRERSMICSRGANDGLVEEWIDPRWFDRADHLHVSGYALLADGQRAAARRAIAWASAAGASVSLDPPPANLIESFGVNEFREELRGANWLFPNEEEGRTLSGVSDEAAIVHALGEEYEAGALTLGARGAIAWRGGDVDRCAAGLTLDVNPTGAGDAYAAGFVVALLSGASLSRANQAACDAATGYLTRRGA